VHRKLDTRVCCEAVRSAILATAWLLVCNVSECFVVNGRYCSDDAVFDLIPTLILLTIGGLHVFAFTFVFTMFPVAVRHSFCPLNK